MRKPCARKFAEVQTAYDAKSADVGPDMRKIEKQIMLQVLDTLWKEHLSTMDHLRQGIHLRAYAQKNPKQEYKRESFELFEELLTNLKYEVVKFLSHVQIQRQDEAELIEQQRREAAQREHMAFQHAEASGMSGARRRGSPTPSPRPPLFPRPLPGRSPRWAAMSPAPAAVVKNTSSATASCVSAAAITNNGAFLIWPWAKIPYLNCRQCLGCAWARFARV